MANLLKHYWLDLYGITTMRNTSSISRISLFVLLMATGINVSFSNSRPINYEKDVRPIINNKCVKCHTDGGIAPFSLRSYQNVSDFIELGIDRAENGLMPPGIAKSDFDVEVNDPVSPAELKILKAWVSGGKIKGDPIKQVISTAGDNPNEWDPWYGRPPDIVINQDHSIHLGGNGDDVYRNFIFKINLPEDLHFKGIQLLPGNKALVHHALLFYLPSDFASELSKAFNNRDGLDNQEDTSYGFYFPKNTKGFHLPRPHSNGHARTGLICTYVPGGRGVRVLDDSFSIIPARSDLAVQFHYHRTGKPEDSLSRIGIWIDKKKGLSDLKVMKPHSVAGDFSVIPKGATNFQVSAVTTFDSEQRLEGLIPHAHNIASSMRYSLIKPDGSRKTILEIPHWDFNWQQTYYFRTPIDIPPNSQIEAVVTYNNSGSNPKNPNNPPMDVWNGESSTDEMFLTGYLLSASKLFDPYEVSFFEFLESMARSRFLRALSDREYRYSFSDDGSVFKKADPSSGISEFKFKSLIDEDAEDAKDRIKKDSER